jgi:hypothetical protein
LAVIVGAEPRRSPHYWNGPTIIPGKSSASNFSSTLGWDRAGSCSAMTMTIAGHRLPPRHPAGEPSG